MTDHLARLDASGAVDIEHGRQEGCEGLGVGAWVGVLFDQDGGEGPGAELGDVAEFG